jgi:hypothetical protein
MIPIIFSQRSLLLLVISSMLKPVLYEFDTSLSTDAVIRTRVGVGTVQAISSNNATILAPSINLVSLKFLFYFVGDILESDRTKSTCRSEIGEIPSSDAPIVFNDMFILFNIVKLSVGPELNVKIVPYHTRPLSER